ncbi:MAG: hypothetical protein J0M15_08690 [Deltaproteobacteria bacterium]|nr:hypothetical protein [Deltaproteobacteria bacterium]
MNRIWNFSLFISFFFFSAMATVESPRGCFKSHFEKCYLGTVGKTSRVHWGENDFFLGKQTILKIQKNKIHFLEGSMVIKNLSAVELQIENNTIFLLKGEYLISRNPENYVIRTMEGVAEIVLRTSVINSAGYSSMKITEGFEINLVPEGSDNFSFSSLRLIPLEPHLSAYAKTMNQSPSEILKYAKEFHRKYKNYTRWFSELNDQLIALKNEEELQKERQKASDKAKRDLASLRTKQQFYHKVFER